MVQMLAAAAVWAIVGPASGAPADTAGELLDGVKLVASPGIPGSLAVWGDDASTVLTGRGEGRTAAPVVVSGVLGKGRFVAFGHDGYFAADNAAVGDTARLILNAAAWALPADQPREAGLVGAQLAEIFAAGGWKAAPVDLSAPAPLPPLLVISPVALPAAALRRLDAHLRAGGGALLAQTGWGWRQVHGGAPMSGNPFNILLRPAGVAWTDHTVERTAPDGLAATPPPALSHGGRAVRALIDLAGGAAPLGEADLAQAAASAADAARFMGPNDTILRPRLRALIAERADRIHPSPASPLDARRGLDRLLLAVQLDEWADSADGVRAHPASSAFPGSVPPDAPRVKSEVQINLARPDWHSTGLYAPPGATLTVDVPAGAAGLRLRIGPHTDGLWHLASWKRAPEISTAAALKEGRNTAASAFGGLVYIDVPGPAIRPGRTVTVTIAGAVRAAWYRQGVTTAEQWAQSLAGAAPWAELEGRAVILTVPIAAARKVKDPEALMRFWDRVLDAQADLATIPRERARPERIVADVQISAGYMHAGYPIMTHLDAADHMTNTANLEKGVHAWGLFHELGHNHQSADWTFDGTGEVTVNLFTMYALEKVCGVPVGGGHPAFADRERSTAAHVLKGADFGKWKADPFLALWMYVQLQEGFGWETYRRVFDEYRRLPPGERPRGDDAKRDQWLVRFSRAAGKNLGPFFAAWGVPVSDQARRAVADLPRWMPEGFPPR
ncbi:MAG: hypothetical protein IBJ11_10440 [Phycisphaerales bacterium]|nr:hypothetical protein [Phycisphaerales bacterium]